MSSIIIIEVAILIQIMLYEEEQFPITRVLRTSDDARVAYNNMSGYYDWFDRFERKFKIRGMMLLDIQPKQTILEIGCGTGNLLIKMAELIGSEGKIYGLDISEGMLSKAIKKIQKSQYKDQIILQNGDAIKLPFEENQFDAVIMSFTLELFDNPDIPLILDQIYHILHPEGKIAVVSLSKLGKHPKITRFYEKLHEKFPVSIDCRPIYAERSLLSQNYSIIYSELQSMWGLGVEIVIGKK